MKLIFFGTPDFAIPSLDLLHKSHHQILAVITTLDKKKGRGLELKSSNLKVNSFCQQFLNNSWLSVDTSNDNDRKIENAILNKAKKIKLAIN
mgnify:CR=1 FL=1